MSQCDLAAELIDGIVRSCPAYTPGTRPIHAPGVAATGWFRASAAAATYTSAAHLSGVRVPVTVRFSNGTGDINELDTVPVVRGMAAKFHLGNVSVDSHGVMHSDNPDNETDLVAMSLPMFFTSTIAAFQEFLVAAIPKVPQARSWLRSAIALLRLDTAPTPAPPPGIPSNVPGIFEFATRHPETAPAVVAMGTGFVPESYTTATYHAVNAFVLTAADGSTRSARLFWEPVNGIWSAPDGATGNFLRDGLKDRVDDGRAEFVLRMQLAEQGDNPADPTRPWPVRRPRIVLGNLRLTALAEDPYYGCELLSFDPVPKIDGIAPSADPILLERGQVYPLSYTRRIQAAAARR